MSQRFDMVVDHGAADESIDRAVIANQLATTSALRERLDDHGGVILGDEVGAGKTYVTFALLAEALAKDSRKGAVIFVPSELLKTKWCDQLQDYLRAAMRDRKLAERLIERITPVNRSLRDDGSFDDTHWGRRPARNAIVITTHRVYSHRTSRADQAACLRAAASLIKVGHKIRPRALLRACDVDPDIPVASAYWARPDVLSPRTLAPLTDVLKRYASGERGLGEASRGAVQEVRRRVGKSSLPDAALVVIDEAHNLKSTQSAIYQALMSVLSSRFDALLFLTATPFQLGRRELLTIVDFFRFARAYEGREQVFDQRVDMLRRAMDDWVDALDGFGAVWRDLDAVGASRGAALITNGSDAPAGAGNLELRAGEAFDRCMTAKQHLESAMRPFIVRSVRDREHCEHSAVDHAYLSEQTRIPMALVDRLLVELMGSGRTFISSALISACSSWEALLSAAIMEEHRESRTRPVLRRFADRRLLGEHPKVAQTVAQCLAGVESGEKTLVFVEREQTGRMLREALNAQIDDAMPDGSEAPSSAALRQRLQDRTRFGWPSLRENYLHTIFPVVFRRDPDRREISAAWGESGTRDLWSRVDPPIEKRNYVVEKRFWEHILFARACACAPKWAEGLSERLRASVENLLAPEYVLNGLDLKSGAARERLLIPATPPRSDYREPRFPFAEAFVGYRSPWVVGREALAAVGPDDRADFVDAAASAIASSHFRQELAALEIDSDPAAHFEAMEGLLLDPASLWPRRFAALSDEARDAVRTTNQRLADARVWALIEALGSNRRVQYIDGSTRQETQQNAVDGFNTPLYPEVIVTTQVLAEGLDLHRFCRRVIHHDLPWNPAKLEQRTGRVDRVGSLSERLRREQPEGDFQIHVWLPYVPGTYDQFIYERVMARRREFRCILGNRPEWRDEVLGEDEKAIPMDESLVQRLQVDLAPRPLADPTE